MVSLHRLNCPVKRLQPKPRPPTNPRRRSLSPSSGEERPRTPRSHEALRCPQARASAPQCANPPPHPENCEPYPKKRKTKNRANDLSEARIAFTGSAQLLRKPVSKHLPKSPLPIRPARPYPTITKRPHRSSADCNAPASLKLPPLLYPSLAPDSPNQQIGRPRSAQPTPSAS